MTQTKTMTRKGRDSITPLLTLVKKAEEYLIDAKKNQEGLAATLERYANDFRDAMQGKPVQISSDYVAHLQNYASTDFNRAAPASNAGFFQLSMGLRHLKIA